MSELESTVSHYLFYLFKHCERSMAGLTKVLLVCKTKNFSRNVAFDEKYYYLMILVDNSKRSMAWPYCEKSMAWPHCERLNSMDSQKIY